MELLMGESRKSAIEGATSSIRKSGPNSASVKGVTGRVIHSISVVKLSADGVERWPLPRGRQLISMSFGYCQWPPVGKHTLYHINSTGGPGQSPLTKYLLSASLSFLSGGSGQMDRGYPGHTSRLCNGFSSRLDLWERMGRQAPGKYEGTKELETKWIRMQDFAGWSARITDETSRKL